MAPTTNVTLQPSTAETIDVDDFDLDVTVLEVVDPAHLVTMTDDNCGQTCAKTTCVSAV